MFTANIRQDVIVEVPLKATTWTEAVKEAMEHVAKTNLVAPKKPATTINDISHGAISWITDDEELL